MGHRSFVMNLCQKTGSVFDNEPITVAGIAPVVALAGGTIAVSVTSCAFHRTITVAGLTISAIAAGGTTFASICLGPAGIAALGTAALGTDEFTIHTARCGAVSGTVAGIAPPSVGAAGGAVDHIAASGTGGCGGIRVRVRIGFGRGPSDGIAVILVNVTVQTHSVVLFIYAQAGCAISGSFTHIAERISIVALGAFAGIIAGRAFSVVISGIVGADAALV